MMRKPAFASAMLLATFSCAHADEAIVRANNQIAVSAGAHNLNYREDDSTNLVGGGTLDTEKGTQAAFSLALVSQRSFFGLDNIYTSLALTYSNGKTDYQGYLQNLRTGLLAPYSSSTNDTTTDVNLRIGKGFVFGAMGQFQLTPYFAYGYHNWIRDMTGPFGYKETYSHHALGAGVMGQFSLTPRLVGSVDFTASQTIDPQMNTSSTNFDLGSKAQFSVGAGVDYAVTQHFHAGANYRLTQFRYGQSPAVNGFLEPSSKTTEQLFLVNVGYAF